MQGSMIDNQDTSAYIKDEPLFNPKKQHVSHGALPISISADSNP